MDPTGRRTQITEEDGRTSSYSYDDLYRLTAEAIIDPVNANHNANHNASWTYDTVGNRLSDTTNGVTTSYSYDANDRLLTQGSQSFTYDDRGSTLSETDGITTDTFVYDSRNKLVEAMAEGSLLTMSYDMDGNPVGKTVNNVPVNYVVDNNQAYAQVVVEEHAADTLDYTFGTDLLGLDSVSGNYTYHTDALGSNRLVTDSAGTAADELGYDAWGEVLAGGDLAENAYRYAGEQFDSNLDKVYLRARYLDTDRGGFTQMDEWVGDKTDSNSLNKYNYVQNDPVNRVDLSGYCSSFSAAGKVAEAEISTIYEKEHPLQTVHTNRSFQTTVDPGSKIPLPYRFVRPDIINEDKKEFAEIKPLSLSGISAGKTQMAIYEGIGALLGYKRSGWNTTNNWINICGRQSYFANVEGILFYTNDLTILSGVLEAATLNMLARANRRSVNPGRGLLSRTNNAISLANRVGAASAQYAKNSIRTTLALSRTIGLRFGL